MIRGCGGAATPSSRGRFGRVRASDESGQIMVVTALALVLMLCAVGLVVDVGHAMLVQRQLQAGVDAAALAGVQHLPDAPVAESVARQYSATPGSKNQVNTVNNAVTTATVSCLTGVPGCTRRDGGVNGITVVSSSRVPTWFGRVIGIRYMDVSAKAVACSPCSIKPLDIMIVLDRTGSMCVGSVTPACGSGLPVNPNSDLGLAKSGVETFLTFMDPALDKVGLALFPPALNASMVDKCPYTPWTGTGNPNPPPPGSVSGRYYGYDQWWHPDGVISPLGSESSFYVVAGLEGADGDLTNDYIVRDPFDGSWDINTGSNLVQRLRCARGAGSTSYALSIEEAKRELSRNGRGNVQDVIIFLSDGAANTSPMTVPTDHWTNNATNQERPCGSGVQSANMIKGSTIIYTIGYDLDGGSGVAEQCRRPDASGHQDNSQPRETGCGLPPSGWGDPGTGICSSYGAIQAMASVDAVGDPLFYNKPDPGQLNDIFRAIALDLAGSRGRLIDATSPLLP